MNYRELDKKAYYGNDLGAVYTVEKTVFKVWAPTADMVKLNLYEKGAKGEGEPYSTQTMTNTSENGIWEITVLGDLNGRFYTYSVTVDGITNEAVDIYAKAVGLNGDRAMVVDLRTTDPEGFADDRHVTQQKMTDAVIWEVHVADFSSAESSGVSEANRGRYLAFTEEGTTLYGEGKIPTCMNYLKDLGINYIHLLPSQNSANDETDGKFNWGYDPKNYNVPEGKYTSNPYDGVTRITEFKKMVQGIHKAGIGVVMDVVYNHTFSTEGTGFEQIVPGYYYRQDEDGNFLNASACGNETASERAMFRKFMIDSILYWTDEYHIDGFRFDLMGIHDVGTMNAIRKALDDAGHEDIILYGEPWAAAPTGLSGSDIPADKNNVRFLSDRIAVFNDDIRDAVKGYVFNDLSKGFVQGGNVNNPSGEDFSSRTYMDNDLIAGIQADANQETTAKSFWTKTAWAKNPSQSVAYVSAHDNLSLWDKLVKSTIDNPDGSVYENGTADIIAMNKLAAATIITSQGLVFFQAGEEFGRTKLGDENSYISDISINRLDWERVDTLSDLNNYYKGLIRLRKAFSPFRDDTNTAIGNMVFTDDGIENFIAYTIQNTDSDEGEWNTVAVILNSSSEEHTVELAVKNGTVPSEWSVVVDKDKAGTDELSRINGNIIAVPACSAMVLVNRK